MSGLKQSSNIKWQILWALSTILFKGNFHPFFPFPFWDSVKKKLSIVSVFPPDDSGTNWSRVLTWKDSSFLEMCHSGHRQGLKSAFLIVYAAGRVTNRIRLRSWEGQRGFKIPMQGFCTHGGGAGMRSEKDSALVMKGLLAIYPLWSEREYSCKRLHRGSV